MKKVFVAKAATLGVLGAGLLFGGTVVTGASAPEANASGCIGWNGIFLKAQFCDNGPWGGGYPGYPGIGYPGNGYPGIGFPGAGYPGECGGFDGCYPPPMPPPPPPPPPFPPPPPPPIPIGYPPFGGPCGC